MNCDTNETSHRMPVHPIFALILCGNLIEVATLISSDPSPIMARKSDAKNGSPLHWAVKKKQKKITKKLLEAGSDFHNKDDAAEEEHSEISTLLMSIEHGACQKQWTGGVGNT